MPDPESVSITELHHFLGAVPLASGATRFCVWSPTHRNISVWLPDQDRVVPMVPTSGGYHVAVVDGVGVSDRYFYRLPAGTDRPDPASRFQPDGVHGPSQVMANQFDWQDQFWTGISTPDLIIYELHIGSFTAAGSFDAAIG